MKREQVLSVLTKDRWVLSKQDLDVLVEAIEQVQYDQAPFEPKHIIQAIKPILPRARITEILQEHPLEAIKQEVVVRLLLNGYLEEQLFGSLNAYDEFNDVPYPTRPGAVPDCPVVVGTAPEPF